MGVFVVGGLRLNGGNVATKQYADSNTRLVLGPRSSGQPIADGVTQGETSWDDSGVSIWTGSLWRLFRFRAPVTTIFELDASVLGGELGRLVTEWPSVVSPLVANSMGTATPRLDEDGGVAFVRLGPGHGYFSINGFQLDTTNGHTITMVVRNHSGSLGPEIPYPFRAYVDDTQELHHNWGLLVREDTTGQLMYDLPGGYITWVHRQNLGYGLFADGMGWVVLSFVVSKEKTEIFKNGISAYSKAGSGPLPNSDPHTIVTIAAGKDGARGCNLDVAFFSASQGALSPTAVVDLQTDLQTRLGTASPPDIII
jgi:hypothetical protein